MGGFTAFATDFQEIYKDIYIYNTSGVRFKPIPALTAAPSPSDSGDITTTALCLLKNKVHGNYCAPFL